MGCEVVVFSSTDNKREEALAMGATEFYAVKGLTELPVERKIHCLLSTGSGQIPWGLYVFSSFAASSTIRQFFFLPDASSS